MWPMAPTLTKVLTILKDLTKNHEEILEKPEPMVLFIGFGESSLDFELRFWTGNSDAWLQLKSQLTVEVYDALNKAKIEIPFPQRDLHIKSADGLDTKKDVFNIKDKSKRTPGKRDTADQK